MKNLIYKIQNENGGLINYKIDSKIIKGLHITKELFKVQENCSNLSIAVKRPNLRISAHSNVKITVIGNVCILTILLLVKKQKQFLIQKDLDLNVLKWQSHKKIEPRFYELIKQAYETMMVANFNNIFNKS